MEEAPKKDKESLHSARANGMNEWLWKRKSLSRNVEKKWFKIMPDKINNDYTNLVT